MRRVAAGLVVFAVCGCSSEASRAEREYEIATEAKMTHDRCRAAHKAKDAWLEEGNQENYLKWTVRAYNACTESNMVGL